MWVTNNKTKHSLLIMLIDAIIINLSIILAYLIRFKFTLPAFNFQPYLDTFLWITLGSIFFLHMYHLYSVSARTRWDDQFYSIILAVALTLMLSISLTYISANYSFPRSVFVLSGLFQTVFMLIWRYIVWRLTKLALGVQKAVVIGEAEEAAEIALKITKFSESHIEFIGMITDSGKAVVAEPTLPVLGKISSYITCLEGLDYDVIVIASSVELHFKEEIACYCYSVGKEALLAPDLYEVLLARAELNLIDDIPFFDIKDYNGDSTRLKRMLDLVIGTLALIFTLPFMLVIGLCIKLDSPGPVIYKQERVTKGGRVFTLYKFRTMVQDAELKSGPVFAVEDDQRATRIGKILRLSRLDELPQFLNVVKGDMSLVGPRPERPFFVEQYSKEINGYDNRHRIKPGITGIAQVAGKYNTGPREKLVLDLLYAKRNNILVDLQILFNTVKVLLMRDKAS